MDTQPSAPAPEVALRNLGLALVELSWSLQGSSLLPAVVNDYLGNLGDLLLEVR